MKASSFLYLVPLLKLLYQITICIACLINPEFANPANPSKFATSSNIVVAILAVGPVGHVLAGFSQTVQLNHYWFLGYFSFCPVIDVFWYDDLRGLGLLFIVVLIVDAVGLILFGLRTLWRWLRSPTPSPPIEKERNLEAGNVKAAEHETGDLVTVPANQNQRPPVGAITHPSTADYEETPDLGPHRAQVMTEMKKKYDENSYGRATSTGDYSRQTVHHPQPMPSPLLGGQNPGNTPYNGDPLASSQPGNDKVQQPSEANFQRYGKRGMLGQHAGFSPSYTLRGASGTSCTGAETAWQSDNRRLLPGLTASASRGPPQLKIIQQGTTSDRPHSFGYGYIPSPATSFGDSNIPEEEEEGGKYGDKEVGGKTPRNTTEFGASVFI